MKKTIPKVKIIEIDESCNYDSINCQVIYLNIYKNHMKSNVTNQLVVLLVDKSAF